MYTFFQNQSFAQKSLFVLGNRIVEFLSLRFPWDTFIISTRPDLHNQRATAPYFHNIIKKQLDEYEKQHKSIGLNLDLYYYLGIDHKIKFCYELLILLYSWLTTNLQFQYSTLFLIQLSLHMVSTLQRSYVHIHLYPLWPWMLQKPESVRN